jgi:hypothetical protein
MKNIKYRHVFDKSYNSKQISRQEPKNHRAFFHFVKYLIANIPLFITIFFRNRFRQNGVRKSQRPPQKFLYPMMLPAYAVQHTNLTAGIDRKCAKRTEEFFK